MITHELARDMVKNNIIEWFREELLAYISQQEQFAKDVKRYIFLDQKNSFELTEAESEEWISLFKKIGLEYEPFKTKGVVK